MMAASEVEQTQQTLLCSDALNDEDTLRGLEDPERSSPQGSAAPAQSDQSPGHCELRSGIPILHVNREREMFHR